MKTETNFSCIALAISQYAELNAAFPKPMVVATYKTTTDMPKELRHTLPDIEELKKLV